MTKHYYSWGLFSNEKDEDAKYRCIGKLFAGFSVIMINKKISEIKIEIKTVENVDVTGTEEYINAVHKGTIVVNGIQCIAGDYTLYLLTATEE